MKHLLLILFLPALEAAGQSSIDLQRASVQRQLASIAAQKSQAPPQQRPAEFLSPPPACEPIAPVELDEMIGAASREHQVDAKVIREVARQESRFYPCAVSPKGAAGLMQLMPATQAQFQVGDPFNARESLNAGTKLLKQLLERYRGDLSLALSAYNAGAARTDSAGGIPAIAETQHYVSDILSRLAQPPTVPGDQPPAPDAPATPPQ